MTVGGFVLIKKESIMGELAKQKQVMVAFCNKLGYATVEDFNKVTQLRLKTRKTYRIDDVIYIYFQDPFFNCYTNVGIVDVSTNYGESAIKKVKYKLKQLAKLRGVKVMAIEKIKDFISDAYFIDKSLIKTEDIIFEDYRTFMLQGAKFSFDCTFGLGNFDIVSTIYYDVRGHNNILAAMLKHYHGVDIKKIKLGEYEQVG